MAARQRYCPQCKKDTVFQELGVQPGVLRTMRCSVCKTDFSEVPTGRYALPDSARTELSGMRVVDPSDLRTPLPDTELVRYPETEVTPLAASITPVPPTRSAQAPAPASVRAAAPGATLGTRYKGPPLAEVAVVDDSAIPRRMIAEVLCRFPYVTLATAFGSAFDLIKEIAARHARPVVNERGFDAVILDMEMPGLDGLATAQLIRTLDVAFEHPTTPILFVTAGNHPEAALWAANHEPAGIAQKQTLRSTDAFVQAFEALFVR